jgi:hypothetical protein
VQSVQELLLQQGGASFQQSEVQRQDDLQSTLPGTDPPPGSPSDLSFPALQQLLNDAADAVRSGGAGEPQP